MAKPFRWSIAKREQLGSLADQLRAPHPSFVDELRETAAKVLAFADDADLAFIGRTPENYFDYLSGAFADVNSVPRLHLVQFSMRWANPADLTPENIAALADYFEQEGIDPASIAKAPRPLAIVDTVVHGGTMHSVITVLQRIAERQRVDWNTVQRRLKIIALVMRGKNSPNAWRWQQKQDWLDAIPDTDIMNVSASESFLATITGFQVKVTESFHAGRWQEERPGAPKASEEQREAIAFAAFLYDLGRTREERHALAAHIAKTQQMRQAATRAMVLALRGG